MGAGKPTEMPAVERLALPPPPPPLLLESCKPTRTGSKPPPRASSEDEGILHAVRNRPSTLAAGGICEGRGRRPSLMRFNIISTKVAFGLVVGLREEKSVLFQILLKIMLFLHISVTHSITSFCQLLSDHEDWIKKLLRISRFYKEKYTYKAGKYTNE